MYTGDPRISTMLVFGRVRVLAGHFEVCVIIMCFEIKYLWYFHSIKEGVCVCMCVCVCVCVCVCERERDLLMYLIQ
jgi:hypothetical protein